MGWYFEESPAVRDAAGLKRSATKILNRFGLSTEFGQYFHFFRQISCRCEPRILGGAEQSPSREGRRQGSYGPRRNLGFKGPTSA